MPRKKPELLAPAGDWECVRAAVANGADCVYFGLTDFNARLRADNFTENDLPQVMKFLHDHGCKGYVTLNVLIFTDELAQAQKMLMTLAQNNVDAVIIQDIGLASLAREVTPSLRVHASTQMTITSQEGIEFAKKLGVKQVVLARELSLREIAKFNQGEDAMPLETFVHGALCVAYSGQCLTSESLGQRSANRGECAQACRMPYDLIVDGVLKELGDKKYLLSPQDLASVDEIPELMKLGIASFKIEGRLKSPEYVAAISKVYRKTIDAVWDGEEDAGETPEDRYIMEMAFSRGLHSGWLHGVNHQQLVHARFGKKRGPLVGLIRSVGRDFVEVESTVPLQPGDGICFDTGEDTNDEQGGRIYEIAGHKLRFQHGKIDFARLRSGDRIWKTDDPKLNKELTRTFEGKVFPRRNLSFEVRGEIGKPLELIGRSGSREVVMQSRVPLIHAEKHGLSENFLHDQLGRLGGTPFVLVSVSCKLGEQVMLPVSEINHLRRAITEALLEEDKKAVDVFPVLDEKLAGIAKKKSEVKGGVELSCLCRSMEQLQAVLDAKVPRIYVDFEDIRKYREAVEAVRAFGSSRIYLATPRIQKAGEQGFFRLIENAEPDGILVRNLGALDFFKKSPLARMGDFSLNVSNPISAALLMDEGLEAVTISYDLSVDQVESLLRAAPPEWFELTLHQYMPMFHMEHCVFAAFLSDGTDHTNCGRPCDHHKLQLRDRVGMLHTVKADVGCRNTVFNGQAQTGANFFEKFIAAGLRKYRVELLNETPAEARSVLQAYKDLLSGKIDPLHLSSRIKVLSRLGVTSGTLKAR